MRKRKTDGEELNRKRYVCTYIHYVRSNSLLKVRFLSEITLILIRTIRFNIAHGILKQIPKKWRGGEYNKHVNFN